jgi:hypothetical protein
MSKRPSTTDHDQSVTEPGDGDPFLSRWARRKRVARAGGDPDAQQPERSLDGEMPAGAVPTAGEQPLGGDDRPPVELTDEDMPAVDAIDESTDMSGFFSPKVTEAVKKAALRKFFHSPAFNVVDGLDDYDDDFRNFAALGDIVTSDMRSRMEPEAESAGESLSEDGQAGDESRDGRGTSPGMDEVERSTTAGTQEVEQCQEQLPRMPEPRAKHDCRDAGGRAMHGEIAEDARAETPVAQAPPVEHADETDEPPEMGAEDSAPRTSAAAEPDESGVTRDPGRQAKAGPGKLRPKGAGDNDA